MLRDANFFQ
jgi:hypothetical protein